MRIQHNIMAMNAYRNYNNNTNALSKNLEKLSSGYRINRAGDDAAGLAISEKMRAQVTGLETAQKNAKDGISMVQTAEGAMTEVHDMLNRMVELADQSANGTYDNTTDRANLQKEFDQLKSEIDRIADSSNFNGISLLDGSLDTEADIDITATVSGTGVTQNGDGTVDVKAAVDGTNNITIDGIEFTYKADNLDADKGEFKTVDDLVTAAAKKGITLVKGTDGSDATVTKKGEELTLQIGDTTDAHNQLKVEIKDMHAEKLGLTADVKIGSQEEAQAAVNVLKDAINTVSSVRGTLGAAQNRLDHTINNLSVMTENIQDAESTIRDTDVADEMMAYTKNNILSQSAQAMLAQANQVPQGVLQLLQ